MAFMLPRLLQALADAVFPPRCRGCSAFLTGQGRQKGQKRIHPEPVEIEDGFGGIFDGLLCDYCRAGLSPVRPPMCIRCGTLFAGGVEEADHLCGNCLDRTPRFRRARAAGVYEATLLVLLRGFKYRFRTELSRPLGRLLFEAFTRYWEPSEIDAIVPVPLHLRRMHSRGFNQAELLGRRLAEALRREREAPVPLRCDALVRRRSTAPQTGLGRRERSRNIAGAFAAGPRPVEGLRLLLVDDVYTTGATVDECSRVLAEAGAARIDVLTLARSLPEASPLRPFAQTPTAWKTETAP